MAFADDGSVLIGDSAKAYQLEKPENVVYDLIYLLGRDFEDAVIQEGIKRWPFKVFLAS